MQIDAVPMQVRRGPLSGRVALNRAATGLGLTAAMLAMAGLLWADALDLTLPVVAIGSMRWLHDTDDPHAGRAAAAGYLTSLAVAIVAAATLRQGEPTFAGDIAFAAMGVAAGSQIYAVVTRRGRRPPLSDM